MSRVSLTQPLAAGQPGPGPIRAQYSGHVTSLVQSEPSITDLAGHAVSSFQTLNGKIKERRFFICTFKNSTLKLDRPSLLSAASDLPVKVYFEFLKETFFAA